MLFRRKVNYETYICIVFTILWMFITILTIVPAQEDHLIPDANLRSAVREALELPDDASLTKEHLKELTRVVAWDSEISDLKGLEHATNLKNLSVCRNQISDLSPLASLFHLERLSLCVNQISDISPLSNLANLTLLDLGANGIEDIIPIERLKNLEVLNIGNNSVTDITPVANLKQLQYFKANSNKIINISPLTGLENLNVLILTDNPIVDFSPLDTLINLERFDYNETCEISPILPTVQDRIQARTFPSIFQAWAGLTLEGLSVDERAAYHDLQFGPFLSLTWLASNNQPTHGLSTQIGGDIRKASATRQRRLDLNPNMLFLVEIRIHNHQLSDAYPPDSDFWLRDKNGEIVFRRNPNAVGVSEYYIDFLKPHVQDKLIERIVAIAGCGLFDGIMIDGFAHNATGFVGRSYYNVTDEEIVSATTRVLSEVRSQVRDDFLILVNAGMSKATAYTEHVNGSFMETGEDNPNERPHQWYANVEDDLLWNEENLREPRINCLEGWGIGSEPADSPDNQKWMRVFTTMSLTHSDGYVIYKSGQGHFGGPDHIWYDFWDADLGKPIGEKAQLYENRDGLFLREFTNGWAVYNRSGQAQKISLPGQTTGVASGVTSFQHTVPDLDGEMFLKTDVSADVNGDGKVNILDLVAIANAFGAAEPDLNGDGVVNIQDLVIVANAF